MFNIGDMFRTKAPVTNNQQQNPDPNNQQQNNQQQQNNTQQNTNKNVNDKLAKTSNDPDQGTKNQDDTKNNESPTDKYKNLWETDDTKDASQNHNFFADVTPQKLMEAASKMDFKKAIKQEHLDAIKAGGEGAQVAFAESLNDVARTIFAQSAHATMGIVTNAFEKSSASNDARIQDAIRTHNLGQGTYQENPALKNPAFKSMVDGTMKQMRTKFPDATDVEVRKLTSEYFDQINAAMNPKKAEEVAKGSEQTDWNKYMAE